MPSLIVHLMPVAVGAAVSPALLVVSLELLATEGRHRYFAVAGYLAGSAAPLLLLGVVGLFVAPQLLERRSAGAGHVVDVVDLVLGGLLVTLAVRRWLRQRGPQGPLRAERTGSGRLVMLGIGMMVTNVTTIVLVIAALREIARADVSTGTEALGLSFLIVMALMPIWVPLTAAAVAPGTIDRLLLPASAILQRHGSLIAGVACLVFGSYLIGRGASLW